MLIPSTGTKDSIKAVSLKCFTEQEYEGTTMKEISDALGMTAGSLYHHFNSKKDIYIALIEDAITLAEDYLEAAIEHCEAKTVPERLEHLFEYILQLNRQHPAMTYFLMKSVYFTEEALEDEVGETLREWERLMADQVMDFLESSHKRRMPKTAFSVVLQHFVVFVCGYLLQLQQEIIEDTEEEARVSWEAFWKGIK